VPVRGTLLLLGLILLILAIAAVWSLLITPPPIGPRPTL